MEFNLRRYNFDFIYNDNLNRPKYRLKIESTNFKVSLQLGARYHHRMRPSVYFFVLFRFGVFFLKDSVLIISLVLNFFILFEDILQNPNF